MVQSDTLDKASTLLLAVAVFGLGPAGVLLAAVHGLAGLLLGFASVVTVVIVAALIDPSHSEGVIGRKLASDLEGSK